MADSQEYRRKFFAGNLVFLCILFLILIAVFLVRDLLSGAKLDLTTDKIYTISQATKDILSKLKDEVTINYYASEELPGQLKTLKRDTKDLFDEFYELSNHKVNYTIINPEEKALAEAEKSVAEYMEAKQAGKTPKEPEPVQSIRDLFGGRKAPSGDDIKASREKAAATFAAQQQRPKDEVYKELLTEEFKRQSLQKLEQEGIGSFPYNEREGSKVSQGRVFSSIEIKYLAKEPEVIPVHYQIENLEYELASRILKLTTTEKPVVAFFDARKPAAPPPNPMNPMPPPQSEYEQIIRALGEIFDVRTVDLKENDSLDDLVRRIKEDRFRKETEEIDDEAKKKEVEAKQDKTVKPEDLRQYVRCFIVAQPDQLEPRQVYEISRAVSLGVSTIFLVSRYSMDISDRGVQQGIPLNMISPGVEDLFRKWGIEIGHEVLASNEAGSIVLPTNLGGLRVMMPRPLTINVQATQDSIDQASPLTNRIPSIIFPATMGLKVLADTVQKNGLKADVLARTTPEAWSVKVDPFQKRDPFRPNAGFGASVSQYQEDLVAPKRAQEFRDFIDPAPLAVLLQGKLPFAFEGETIPDWKKEEKKDRDKDDPHAGIPGFGGDFGGDRDVALNAVDPDDAKSAAPPAPAQAPAPTANPPQTPPAIKAPPPVPGAAPSPNPPATPPLVSPALPAGSSAPPAPAGAAPVTPTTAPAGTPTAPAGTPTAPAGTPTAPAGTPTAPAGTPTAPAGTPTAPAGPAPAAGQPQAALSGEAKTEAAAAKPEEKPAEKPKASVQPGDGRVLVLASVDMMKDAFLTQQSREYQANVNFFYNAIENFGLGNQLIEIRRKQLTERHFKQGSDKTAGYIKWFNIAGVPAIVGILGLVYFLVRRADSMAYERKFIQKQS